MGISSPETSRITPAPDLDTWIERPLIRLCYRREAEVGPAELWSAAQSVRLADTRALGRLVRVRIPGVPPESTFDDMFRSAPFNILHADRYALVSGLVGRIWTLRRDYPTLGDPEEFRQWAARGTVRVLFATWVESVSAGGAALVNEVRVDAVDRTARIGLSALRPLITTSHNLIGSDGLAVAIRRTGRQTVPPDTTSGARDAPGASR